MDSEREKVVRSEWKWDRSSGCLVFRHFLSAALSGVLSALRVSDSQGAGGRGLAGLVDKGQRRSNADEIEVRKVEVAVSDGRVGKESWEGREESIADARAEGSSDFRLRRVVVVSGVVGVDGSVEREREKVMK